MSAPRLLAPAVMLCAVVLLAACTGSSKPSGNSAATTPRTPSVTTSAPISAGVTHSSASTSASAGGGGLAAVASAPAVGPFAINKAASPASWPDVCTMTSAVQLKALDPMITGLKGAPAGTRQQIAGTASKVPHNNECQFNLVTTFDQPGSNSHVEITIEAISPTEPTLYQQSHGSDAPASVHKNLPGGARCDFDGTSTLDCLKGNIEYYVAGTRGTQVGTTLGDTADAWLKQIELPLAAKLSTELT